MQKPTGGFHSPLQQLFLLEARVRQAGAHLPDDTAMAQRFHGIKCVLCGLDCVINMREVVEVFEERQITAIPGTAHWIEGVMNYRGTLVPVYRPHDYLTPGENTDRVLNACDGPLLVIRKGIKGTEFNAIRVNRMFGMQKFNNSDLQAWDRGKPGFDAPEHYVDELINSDGRTWHRFEIQRLLEKMNLENPYAH